MAWEINAGLLDTKAPERIANSFYEGQQEQQKNALMQAQLQTAQRTNKLADLAMADDEAGRQAWKNANGDTGQVVKNLMAAGQGKQAMELQGKMSAQQKDALATQKAQLENHLKTFEVVGQIMSGVKDQASYDASRQQIAQIVGPEAAAKSPAVYDPAVIEQSRQKAMSVKDQLANKWKEIDAQLNADKFAYQQTSDARSDERIRSEGALNRGVQMRGQNISDSRARDGMAQSDRQHAATLAAGNIKPLTEVQANALTFSERMSASDKIIAEQAKAGIDRPGNIKTGVESTLGAIPIVGGALANAGSAATNWTQSAGQQKVEQAQRDFINAVLRKESGAAIGQSEFDNARKQYFPAMGDSKSVLEQKAQNRALAIRAMSAGVPEQMRTKFQADAPKPSGQSSAGQIKFLGFE